MRRLLPLLGLLFLGNSLFARYDPGFIYIDYEDSNVSSKWFGPYAFPVPEQLGGEICNKLQVSLAGDYTLGHLAGTAPELLDRTQAVTFAVRLPLWTDRATFSAWGEIYEFYHDNREVRTLRHVNRDLPLSGHDAGNIYLSLDVMAVREGRWNPSLALRVATLLATGDDFEYARHFDTPGYFMDASTGKTFAFGKCSSLRLSATLGFLCYQVSTGRQLDAFMYGGKLSYSHTYASLGVELGGYNGREADGDAPLKLTSRLDIHFGRFSPFIAYSRGFHDWPFDQWHAGLAVFLFSVN